MTDQTPLWALAIVAGICWTALLIARHIHTRKN